MKQVRMMVKCAKCAHVCAGCDRLASDACTNVRTDEVAGVVVRVGRCARSRSLSCHPPRPDVVNLGARLLSGGDVVRLVTLVQAGQVVDLRGGPVFRRVSITIPRAG